MRGRKPKPTAAKELQGNPGKRPLNKREPRPKTAVKKPRGMGHGAKRFWDDHAVELERLGLLTGVDVPVLRSVAEDYGFMVESAKILHDEGLVVNGGNGEIKKHPAWQIFRDSRDGLRRGAALFGMEASARARLKVAEDAEQLTLAEQLFAAVGDVVVSENE